MALQVEIQGQMSITDWAGMITPFGGSSAPSHWLMCDGSAVSRTTYSVLFGVIGTTFGVGDGSTTFNVPDLRGIFVRGAGTHGSLTDAGSTAFTATLGASENDKMQGHWHWIEFHKYSGSNWMDRGSNVVQQGAFTGLAGERVTSPKTDGANGTPRTGNETQPVNLALNHIIHTGA